MSDYQRVLENGIVSRDGKLSSGACVWFYKKAQGKIFLLAQKRAKTVHNGGFYDVSAGGHIDGEETPVEGALRETEEELGVSIEPEELVFLCAYRTEDKIVYVFISDRTAKDDVFTLDPGEVESVEWVPLDEFEKFFEKQIKPNLRSDKFHLEILKGTLENK